ELQTAGLIPKLKLLHQRQIPVVYSRSANRRNRSIAIIPLRRPTKGCGVEEAVEGSGAPRQLRLSYQHGSPPIPTPCDIRAIRRIPVDWRGQPSGKSGYPGELPIVKHAADHHIVGHLAQLGQVPNIVDHQHLSLIETGWPI